MIFKLILDRKNKPNRPPYVKDAILRPTSIKDELVSSNKKANIIKTIPHNRLINFEAFKELFLSNISTTVDVVSELIDCRFQAFLLKECWSLCRGGAHAPNLN